MALAIPETADPERRNHDETALTFYRLAIDNTGDA
jgi:hypothetical protein